MHPLLAGWDQHQPQGAHSQPWDCQIHPRHLSGACWVSWEQDLGLGRQLSQSLRSQQGQEVWGAQREDLSSPGKCLEWMWEPKSSPCLEEEPPAP